MVIRCDCGMPGSFGNHVEKLKSLAREWPTATCNASRSNGPAKQSKMCNECVVRGWARSISKEDPRYTSRTKGVPFSSDTSPYSPMILPAWKQGQIERCSIRLEFTLLW